MFISAKPVWAKDLSKERNTLLFFQTEISSGDNTKIKISCDCYYRLNINGNFVAHGPARCGKGYFRMDEIDISKHIDGQNNNIEIFVCHYGINTFEFINQPPFFMCEIISNGNILKSTANATDFSVKKCLSKEQMAEKYSYQRGFLEQWELPIKFSEDLKIEYLDNKNIVKRNSPYPDYKRIEDFKVISNGTFHLEMPQTDRLIKRFEKENKPEFSYNTNEIKHLYRLDLFGIKNDSLYTANEKFISKTIKENQFIICEIEREKTGFFSFSILSHCHSTVYLVYDEILTDNDVIPDKKGNETISLLPIDLKAGTYNFVSLEPVSLKYFKILTVKGEVVISDFKFICYENSLKNSIAFNSDDEQLNRIWKAAENTFAQNAVDLYTDCPSRERAGWLCDSYFTAKTEADLFGNSSIEHDFLENFLLATDMPNIPEKMFPMCYPANATNFIPNWAMFFCLELEEYVNRTNDQKMLETAKDKVYGLLDYFKDFENGDGLLERLNGWIFVEWSGAKDFVQDVNFPTNMMYFAMIKSIARLFSDKLLDKKAENIKDAIRKLSFNGKFFCDRMKYNSAKKLERTNDISEVCQYYAFFTGIADKQTYPELFNIIVNDFGAGGKAKKTYDYIHPANAFIGNFLRLEILSHFGEGSRIIDEIKDYFDYMAIRTGTLWENDTVSASCNHGFASYLIHIILRDCLGVTIDSLNKKIILSEFDGKIKNATLKIPYFENSPTITVSNGVRKFGN